MGVPNFVCPIVLLGISASFPCVAAADIVPLVASAAVCAVMLFVIITMIVLGFIWSDLMKNWSTKKGKVKMPKSYFRKKEEAKRKLLNGSINSRPPSLYNPTTAPNKTADTASWVQGWQQENTASRNAYEEQNLTMDLGDEVDKEYRIETTVVDNEVLDVGPYRGSALPKTAQPTTGNVYSEPYIYTTGDRATITRSSEETKGVVSSNAQKDVYVAKEMKEMTIDRPDVASTISNNFDELVRL